MQTFTPNRTKPIQRRSVSTDDKWLVIPRKISNPSLRLFCFSHAGGSAAVYHNWHKHLPADIEICALQLPGRGHRICEPLIDEFGPLVEAICDGLMPHLNQPFAFFGHSMGAMLAFEVTRTLRARGANLPIHLMVSGCRAPHIPLGREPIHHLEGGSFLNKLRELNGTPEEALENLELMEMMEPILRADFQVIEKREYKGQEALPLPISVFGGLDDNWVPAEYLQGWQQHTNSSFWHSLFPGDHFYYLTEYKPLLRQLTDLLCLMPRSAAH